MTCQHPDGCDRPVRVRGWCGMHYTRVLRHGDPGPAGPIPRRGGSTRSYACAVDGCDDYVGVIVDGVRYCRSHGYRADRYGDPLAPYPAAAANCRHPDGCDQARHTDGWCRMHAERIRVHGDPGPVGQRVDRPKRQAVECWAPRNDGSGPCGRPTHAHGLCKTHAKRLERNGTLVPRRRFAHT